MTPPMDRDELIARLRALVDADDDHMVATEEDLEWLVEQLLVWPRRIHPERTKNDRFLRYSIAATLLAALESRPAPTEQRAREVLRDFMRSDEFFPDESLNRIILPAMLRFATDSTPSRDEEGSLLATWRDEIGHPNNRLLFTRMVEKAGIDLGADDIASALAKVAALKPTTPETQIDRVREAGERMARRMGGKFIWHDAETQTVEGGEQ